MGEKTAIEWTDKTHNFWYGCTKVSQGCKHCYAERDMTKYGKDFRTVTRAKGFDKPLSWKDSSLVFVNSWSDFFIKEADGWRDDAWDVIRRTPHLIYQILTKRPERIMECLPDDWNGGYPNVWLGVSVENQEAFWRIQALATIASAVRFLSIEPLLEPLGSIPLLGFYHWIIVGGESGPEARPMTAESAEDIRQQRNAKQIPFFFKQMGGTSRINGHWGGNTLNGETYQEFPLRGLIRQLDLFGGINVT